MFGKRFSRALAVTTVASLVMATAAFADEIQNNVAYDVDAAADVVELAPSGATAAVLLSVVPTGGDGKPGCNLTGSTTFTASVGSSNTAVATVSPSSVTFSSCGDTPTLTVTSGIAGSAVVSLTQTGNTTDGSFNVAPATFTVRVTATDSTAPVISYVLAPASPDGANGWYTSNVTLTWTVTENESPDSLVTTGCVDQNITADQAETTYSCSASSDGGSAAQVDVAIKRDATAPSVSLVGGPQDGQSYYFGSVPAAPTCSASDATSGLAAACAVSGYGTATGTHTVTASVTDNAGNSSSASASYTVLAWTVSGFYRPVDMGVLNSAKAGSTIPLKFEVFAGTTELTDIAIVKTFTQKIACDNTGTADAIEEYATGNTSLRYDTTGGQFIFNWKTPSTKGCYRVTLETQDGSKITADFQLK